MLLVGSAVVADGARFKDITLPSLERMLAPEDILISTGDVRGIAGVYNDFVHEARSRPGCEALVLLHDDVEGPARGTAGRMSDEAGRWLDS